MISSHLVSSALVAGYGRAVDDRDVNGLRALFTPDVTFGPDIDAI
jgi:hypothetical protein